MRPIIVIQTSNKKVLGCIRRRKKLWKLYGEVSIKIESNPGMPPQINEYFASVFSKASECAGEGKCSGLMKMRPLSWKSPSLRELGVIDLKKETLIILFKISERTDV